MAEIASTTRVARVDMTPMVDLGFLLITFFMFTTSFYQEYIVKLNMPDKAGKPPKIKVSNSLTLILGKDNKLFWYQHEAKDLNTSNLVGIDYGLELRKLIIQKRNYSAIEAEKFVVIIKPTDESVYQNTIDALDEMLITNQERYVLADIAPKEKLVYESKLKP